jgi:hypothetical protein
MVVYLFLQEKKAMAKKLACNDFVDRQARGVHLPTESSHLVEQDPHQP